MNFSSIILLVVLNFLCTECFFPHGYSNMDFRISGEKPKRYCGKHLVNAMALICHDKYNMRETRTYPKTNIFNYDVDYINGLHENVDDEASYPFIGKSSSLSLLPNKERRTSPGIVQECCDKPCYTSELRAYCYFDDE